MDENNVKALYRRGCALLGLVEWERADVDLRRAVQLEPSSKPIRAALDKLRALQAENTRKEADTFGGLFGRMEQVEDRERRRKAAAAAAAANATKTSK